MATKRVTAVGWYTSDISSLHTVTSWAIVQPGLSGGTGLHPYEGLIATWALYGTTAERGWTVVMVSPPAATGNTEVFSTPFGDVTAYEHTAVFDVTYPDWYTPVLGPVPPLPAMPGDLFDLKVEFNSFVFYYARISEYPTAYAGYNPDAVPYLAPTQSAVVALADDDDNAITVDLTAASQYSGGSIVFVGVWVEYFVGNDVFSYPANPQGYVVYEYPASFVDGVDSFEFSLLSEWRHVVHIGVIDSFGYVSAASYDFTPQTSERFDSLADRMGFIWRAVTLKSGGRRIRVDKRQAAHGTTWQIVCYLPGAVSPSLTRDKETGLLYLLARDIEADVHHLWRCRDGETFQRIDA